MKKYLKSGFSVTEITEVNKGKKVVRRIQESLINKMIHNFDEQINCLDKPIKEGFEIIADNCLWDFSDPDCGMNTVTFIYRFG